MEDGENILPSRLNIVSLRVHHLRHTADNHVANSCWSVIDRKENVFLEMAQSKAKH